MGQQGRAKTYLQTEVKTLIHSHNREQNQAHQWSCSLTNFVAYISPLLNLFLFLQRGNEILLISSGNYFYSSEYTLFPKYFVFSLSNFDKGKKIKRPYHDIYSQPVYYSMSGHLDVDFRWQEDLAMPHSRPNMFLDSHYHPLTPLNIIQFYRVNVFFVCFFVFLIWSPLVRSHLFDHLLWSIFQSSLHILHITNHAGPSVRADIGYNKLTSAHPHLHLWQVHKD